jgi:hypothetical protein
VHAGALAVPRISALPIEEVRDCTGVNALLENHDVELGHAISHAPLRLGVGSRRFPQNGREEDEG